MRQGMPPGRRSQSANVRHLSGAGLLGPELLHAGLPSMDGHGAACLSSSDTKVNGYHKLVAAARLTDERMA